MIKDREQHEVTCTVPDVVWVCSSQYLSLKSKRVYSATTCVSNIRGRSGRRCLEENLITQQDIRIVCLHVCFLFLFLPFRVHTWKGYIKEPTNIKQNFQLSLVRVIYQSTQVTFHVFFSTGNWKRKHWCANMKEHPYVRKW